MAVKLSNNPAKTAYICLFGLWVLITFLVLYPLIRLGLIHPKMYRFGHAVRKIWGKLLLWGGAIRVKMHYEERPDPKQAYIITPNHTSQLDIVTLTTRLPLYFNYMAKAELERVPLFGIWFRTLDIAVDRKDARKAAMSYRKALNWLEQGNSMAIFPEGTISGMVPKLIKFKDGPFKMAIEKQLPVLPVTIIGNWRVLPDQGVFEGQPGIVHQYVHKAIPTKGMTMNDLETLKDQVFQVINNKLRENGY